MSYSDACIAVGIEEGIEKGIVKGREEERKKAIMELLKSMSVNEIVKIMNGMYTLDEVLLVAKEMSMN